jgi:hypothetical protein
MMPFPLSELFPDRDYRFHLTLRRGDLAEFFGAPSAAVLAERRRWLAGDPARYVVGGPDSAPLVAEPDLALLAPDAAGEFRLRAGAVCFPSSWAVTEKFGRTLDDIHGVVPGLNPALAPAIGQFLRKLRPGAPYERANWGLAATPELNLHPALNRPRLGAELDVTRTWLRIEEQILAAMPATGGILFGIKIIVVPLARLLDDPALRAGLRRALATMPDELARYKGLAPVRAALLARCG